MVLRIAVVGVGSRAQHAHLPVIASMRDVWQLTAVCDINPYVSRRIGEAYHVPYYTDIEKMLVREELDVVDLCTPPDTHHIIAKTIAEHSVHIFCETPIAITLPCADFMIKAVSKAGVKMEVSENYHRMLIERSRFKLLEEGIIGEVSRVYNVNYRHCYHGMSLLRLYAKSEARSVTGACKTFSLREGNVERWDHAIICFKNHVVAIHDFCSPRPPIPWRRTRYIEVDGTSGCVVNDEVFSLTDKGPKILKLRPLTVSVNGMEVPERIVIDDEGKLRTVLVNPYKRYMLSDREIQTGGSLISVADMLMSIAEAVRRETEPEYGALQARKDLELHIAMRESSLRGSKPVKIPLTSLTRYERQVHRRYEEKYGHKPLDDAITLTG